MDVSQSICALIPTIQLQQQGIWNFFFSLSLSHVLNLLSYVFDFQQNINAYILDKLK